MSEEKAEETTNDSPTSPSRSDSDFVPGGNTSDDEESSDDGDYQDNSGATFGAGGNPRPSDPSTSSTSPLRSAFADMDIDPPEDEDDDSVAEENYDVPRIDKDACDLQNFYGFVNPPSMHQLGEEYCFAKINIPLHYGSAHVKALFGPRSDSLELQFTPPPLTYQPFWTWGTANVSELEFLINHMEAHFNKKRKKKDERLTKSLHLTFPWEAERFFSPDLFPQLKYGFGMPIIKTGKGTRDFTRILWFVVKRARNLFNAASVSSPTVNEVKSPVKKKRNEDEDRGNSSSPPKKPKSNVGTDGEDTTMRD
ncbi:predicted protein [Chaetoceros tenuissimus]|uniref:Uncharacterized protein n=1 Tax=Chaetoceros tenuissimus TaxID=426638 RepID=A0AAD3CJY4_9STRA|nr:predicted protein [Chaetoceros tenuissimus]